MRVQPLANSAEDVRTFSVLGKRIYNYYWNRYTEFQAMTDKTLGFQLEKNLYEVARIFIIQNTKWSLDFKTTSLPAKIGSKYDGSITYVDTLTESKKGKVYNQSATGVSLEYNFDMFKEAQIAGIVFAKVDKNLFKSFNGSSKLSDTLYKISAIDLTSNTFEEIKKTNVTNGVKISFTGLTEDPNKKRACVFYSDKEQMFNQDIDGNLGCQFIVPNKTGADNKPVPDNTKADCICNHNTIFGLSEYIARATPRQDMNESSRLSFVLSIVFLILFFTTF